MSSTQRPRRVPEFQREAPNFDSQGWCQRTGLTCHTTLMRHVDGISEPGSLEYVRDDCRAAVAALPEGRKAGHYEDTAHYCSMRLRTLRGC
jgi:hypothetical protein